MLPKTCCWRRSRCSTRYCRNRALPAEACPALG
jgi:hypothetical protein